MTDKEKAKLKDQILFDAIRFKESPNASKSGLVGTVSLYKQYFSEIDPDVFRRIVDEIIEDPERPIESKITQGMGMRETNVYLIPNGYTAEFLGSGGFSKKLQEIEYLAHQDRIDNQMERELRETQIKLNKQTIDLNHETKVLNAQARADHDRSKRDRWRNNITFVIGTILIIIQIVTGILGGWESIGKLLPKGKQDVSKSK